MVKRIEKTDEEWRQQLSPEAYAVTRKGATERAFTGRYHDFHEDGIYRCVACGTPLFESDAKFESGSGWPSFTRPVEAGNVNTREDRSHGMRRVEVLCAACDSHLGHVFPDGPPEAGGLRFCVNSAALDFEARDKAGQT
ncbi:MAG TPA: peptide-methionine (R)-S-oxide reductase MsrB [Gammaproteobacteria bacterium]